MKHIQRALNPPPGSECGWCFPPPAAQLLLPTPCNPSNICLKVHARNKGAHTLDVAKRSFSRGQLQTEHAQLATTHIIEEGND